jgi:hypothetical protein
VSFGEEPGITLDPQILKALPTTFAVSRVSGGIDVLPILLIR